MPLLSSLLSRVLLVNGAGAVANLAFQFMLLPVVIGMYTASMRAFDAVMLDAPAQIYRVYYVSGLSQMLAMFVSAVTTGIIARITVGPFKTVLGKLFG